MVLNNLEVSSEYIIKLKAELEAECHIFTENTQREKIKSCLHDLTETSKNYKQLLQVLFFFFGSLISNSQISKPDTPHRIIWSKWHKPILLRSGH